MSLGPQRPDLTDTEQRAHFSLWAMLAAPLLAGNDVRSMDDRTRAILTNRDVIAVDQDPLVLQGLPLLDDPRIIVKPLADGSVAVALFNSDAETRRDPHRCPRDRPVGQPTASRCVICGRTPTHHDGRRRADGSRRTASRCCGCRAAGRRQLACSASLSVMPVPSRETTSTAPDSELRRNRRLFAPDSSRALTVWPSAGGHLGAAGDVEARLDDAVVAERDAEPGVGAEQAALADRDDLLAAAGQRAHDRRAATDVGAVADHHARGDAALDHRRAERAGVEVDEALVHDRRARRQVRAEAHPVGVGDPHARRAPRSRPSAGTCRRRTRSTGPRRRSRARVSSKPSTAHGP